MLWVGGLGFGWITGGGVEEESMHGGPDVEVEVVRVGVRQQVGGGVAMAGFVEQGTTGFGADEVVVSCAVVWSHASL